MQVQNEPASIRTNNTGAQWLGPVARKYGATRGVPLPGGNNAAVFPTPEHGAAAHFALLDKKYSGMTLGAAIKRWGGGSDPSGYLNFVERETGIPRNRVLTREMLAGEGGLALVKAQAQWEAGRPFPLSDDQWRYAQSAALGRGSAGGANRMAYAPESDDDFWGSLGVGKKAEPAKAGTKGGESDDDFWKTLGVGQNPKDEPVAAAPTAEPAKPAGPVSLLESIRTGNPNIGPVNVPKPGLLEQAKGAVGGFIGHAGENIAEARDTGVRGVEQAKEEMASGQMLPHLSTYMPDWRAGGAIHYGLGQLAKIMSPVTGGLHSAVGEPVAGIAGKEAGEKAELLAGLGLPIKGGAKAAASAVPAIAGPKAAFETLVRDIGEKNLPAAIKRLESNPTLAPMDVAHEARMGAAGLAASADAPEAAHILREAHEARAAGAKDVARSGIGALGPTREPIDVIEELVQRARDTGKKGIEPVLKAAKTVDTSPVIAKLDTLLSDKFANPELTRMVGSIKTRMTNDKSTLVAPDKLHWLQSEIGRDAYAYSKSLDPAQKAIGRQLTQIKDSLVDRIDAAAGGKYKPLRKQFSEDKDIHSAFDRGATLDKFRQGEEGFTQDTAEAWKRWMAKAKPDEREAAQQGALATIQRKLEMTKTATSVEAIPQIENTQGKIEALFGKKKAGEFAQLMQDERDKALTGHLVYGNAKTAAVLAQRERLKVRKAGEAPKVQSSIPAAILMELGGAAYTGVPGMAGAATLGALSAARLARHGVGMVREAKDIRHHVELAKLYSKPAGTNPKLLAQLKARAAAPVGAGQKLSNAARRLIGSP